MANSPRRMFALATAVLVLIGLPAAAQPERSARSASSPSAKASGAKLRLRGLESRRTRIEAHKGTEPTTEADTLLVRFRPGVERPSKLDAIERSNGEPLRSVTQLGVEVVSTNGSPDVAERLRRDPRVLTVDPNHIRRAFAIPDDEFFFVQPGFFSSRLPQAWDVTKGSSAIDIAVIDTGVDLDHPDLQARVRPGRDEVNDDAVAQDDNGHGTMVAGVAAAITDNDIGIAGAAWNAGIVPVKVLNSLGVGEDADIIDGILWAADNSEVDVINLSLGGPATSAALESAIDYAIAQGKVVVAAAGNSSSSVPEYPASYDGVISVGASDFFGELVFFSNYGPTVDVVAPGVSICSIVLSAPDDYGCADGTSFSAPLVSGAAALVKARHPTWTPAQVLDRIRTSAIDMGPPGIDASYGWGLLDAYAAVDGRTAASPPVPAEDGFEPNDVAGRATAVPVDGLTGTISPEGDVDWFSISIEGGGELTVVVTPPAEDGSAQKLDPVLTIYSPSPDLEFLGSANAAGPEQPELLTLDVGSAGAYLVKVENFNGTRSPGVPTDPDTYDLTWSLSGGGTPVTPGELLWVRSVTPADREQGVSASVQPTVTFHRDLDPSTVTASTVMLVDGETGEPIPSSVDFDGPTDVATITPDASLTAGSPYIIRVTQVQDADENGMNETFESRFVIASSAALLERGADFNDDGFEDVVITAPTEDLGSIADAGVVHVLYGSASGPQTSGSRMWSQDSTGIVGSAEKGDRFGEAVAAGDLNNDGYDDLVVGASREDVGSVENAGVIHVLLGSSGGLTRSGNFSLHQDSSGVPSSGKPGDRFGAALAVGSFDNVAGDDLAVGAPGESVGSADGAGAVTVFRGSGSGLTTSGVKLWHQGSPDIEFFPETNDGFGSSLGSGDLDGDGHADLAIGTPKDNILEFASEGSVTVMHGSIVGLRPDFSLFDLLSDEGPEPGDRYGTSVAIEDVGGLGVRDGYADLVVGVPGQGVDTSAGRGRVDVVFMNHAILFIDAQQVRQGSGAEAGAAFGTSLAAGRFATGNVLAMGSPNDDLSGQADAGSLDLRAGGGGLLLSGLYGLGSAIRLSQNSGGIPGSAEAGDHFGRALAVKDTDGDGDADLIASAPDEAISSTGKAGVVTGVRDVMDPSRVGKSYRQGAGGIGTSAEAGDRFGAAVL